MTGLDVNRTAQHWDINPWNTSETLFWLQLSQVKQRMAIKESGTPDGNWVDYSLKTHFAGQLPLQRCLSLGCGRGRVERQWAEIGAFVECDAYDISPASIADAQAQAAAAGYNGIHYAVADINQIDLPADRYDAAWVAGSAHHFSQLEHVFSQVATALKPEGLFILHEYVGANRFQFDARQRQVIEACLNLLPPQYRLLPATGERAPVERPTKSDKQRQLAWYARRIWDKLREGSLLSTAGRYWRSHHARRTGRRPIKEIAVPTLRSVIAVDPSEAVRSAEIIPTLRRFFDIVEYRPLGGTILQFLLADIAGNFNKDEAGQQMLEMLFAIEDTLMGVGDLASDFVYVVAAPKKLGNAE